MGDPPTTPAETWTIAALLSWTRAYFDRQGIDEARLAAELLLAKVLDCPRLSLYTRFDLVPTPDQRTAYRALVKEAAVHTPIAYLVGEKEFYSLTFEVTGDVLIPRPETEHVVERTIDLARASNRLDLVILDLGTGSGCIACAILHQLPQARAVGSDVSPAALAVADRNGDRHGLADRVRWVEGDAVDLPADVIPPGGFDVIASNPPYVAAADIADLPANVRDHEPLSALTDHADGLTVYRRIAAAAPGILQPDGHVILEVADRQADAVRAVFAAAGGWTFVDSVFDTTGPHERVLHFVRAASSAGQLSES